MREEILSFSGTQELPFICDICGISYCDGTYLINRPASKVQTLEYIISGSGTVRLNGREFHPEAGDIYFLPAGADHFYYSSGENPWTKIWINVRGPLAEELTRIYKLNNINHIKGINLYDELKKFIDIADKQRGSENIFDILAGVYLEILQKLSIHIAGEKTDISPEAEEIKKYIDNNIGKKITIDELAALIFKSPSRAIRIFKKAYGTTPYEYLLLKKIECAKIYLSNTSMTVKEAAFKLGFSDEHYFSSLFKEKTGKSPREYRGGF